MRLTYAQCWKKLSQAQKPKRGTPWYTREVNRRLGRILAPLFYQWRWTPDQVSILSFCTTSFSLLLIALAPPMVVISTVATIGLLFGYALDSADGQLARLQERCSTAGEWLDHVLDCFKIFLVHSVAMVILLRHFESKSILTVPVAFMALSSTNFYSNTLKGFLLHRTRSSRNEGDHLLRQIALLPLDYGVLCTVFGLSFSKWTFAGAYIALFSFNVVAIVSQLFLSYVRLKKAESF